ncbi:MAG: UMP kinase [Phycisphaerae bacterium]|jgi:uridylate kinase|nr:UMP kinase [Phycisphaerae bacterium]MDP7286908.1 UMP kinase [Phycisphaerae bacterium]
MAKQPVYKRILLKVSGESMCLPESYGVDSPAVESLVDEIAPLVELGVEIVLVIGGGNLIRGRELTEDPNILRTTADQMGMLGTIINGLALGDTLNGRGIPARVLSAVSMPNICQTYSIREARKQLDKGRVVVSAGGTGNPFFTTDTCASLRASELGVDALVKATKVDGVFDSDPMLNPNAKKYDKLTYAKILKDRLGVMDLSAISMCMENDIKILVLQISKLGNLLNAICGQEVGTIVTQ